MVPVTSMLAAISGKPCQSVPVWRKRNVRLTSTALRVLSVERFGRMKTSLKSSLTSVSMRMTYPAERRERREFLNNLVVEGANLNDQAFETSTGNRPMGDE